MIVTGEGKMSNGLKAKTAMFTIFLILATVLAISCRECPTEPKEDMNIKVELLHHDCISALLKVSMEVDSLKYHRFLLENADDTLGEYGFHGPDTVMWLTNLSANAEYSLIAYSLKDGEKQECSDTVQFTTMTPSTKQFTTEVSWFNTSFCHINDVWLFDENNIWAGGRFSYNHDEYSICIYDGHEWIPQESSELMPDIIGMYAFNEQDIWVSACIPDHYKDSVWTHYDLWNMGVLPSERAIGVYQIWGSSPNDVYFVGDSGAVVHYDGQNFGVMETGTKLYIKDIDGDEYGNVAILAYDRSGFESQVLVLKDGHWQSILHSYDVWGDLSKNDCGFMWCMDVFDGFVYIMSWQGMIKYHISTNSYTVISAEIDANDIDVVDYNDIMAFSGYDINYYNGVSWTKIIEDDGSYYCGRYNGSIGCMAGFSFCIVRLK